MSEIQDYFWDFTSVPTFFDDWNNNFTLFGFGTDTYEFCFCNYASTNINDCLSNKQINTNNVSIAGTVDCYLQWDSNQRTISLRNDVVWDIGTNIYPIKAIFLRNKSTGYVMGYCIHINSFDVTNKITIEKNSILWSIESD